MGAVQESAVWRTIITSCPCASFDQLKFNAELGFAVFVTAAVAVGLFKALTVTVSVETPPVGLISVLAS